MREFRKKNSTALAKTGDGKTAPTIVGDVVIDPTATVHPTAKVRVNRTGGAAITHLRIRSVRMYLSEPTPRFVLALASSTLWCSTTPKSRCDRSYHWH